MERENTSLIRYAHRKGKWPFWLKITFLVCVGLLCRVWVGPTAFYTLACPLPLNYMPTPKTNLFFFKTHLFSVMIGLFHLAINSMGKERSRVKPSAGMFYTFHRTETKMNGLLYESHKFSPGVFLPMQVLFKTCLLCSSQAMPPLGLAEFTICCDL